MKNVVNAWYQNGLFNFWFGCIGIAAALRTELPASFIWQAYRAVLGEGKVPATSPFDKELLLWRLMRLLPSLLAEPVFAPLARFLAQDADLRKRHQLAERLADLFDQSDVVFAATNPDLAFGAAGPLPTTVGDVDLIATYGFDRAIGNNGALTIPANLSGLPAVSIPVGTIDGAPVGMQIIGRHHEEPFLLDLALRAERERPWPLVAPSPGA